MSGYSNIVRLTRPVNLLIVTATMLVVKYGVLGTLMQNTHIGMSFRLSAFEFFLLILSAVMLTAAGNIINDYFDQKVDRINRPDRVIIGKYVKRRVAIVLHQVLNALAVLLAVYVCYKTWYWWPLLIPVMVSTLLWWYSPFFKKKVFIGNLVVALCTAAVPLWAVIYEIHELKEYYTDMLINAGAFFQSVWLWAMVITGSAFILTLVREAIKDIEDLQGDGDEHYRTLPIAYGISFTKKYVLVLLFLFITGIGYIGYKMYLRQEVKEVITITICILLPFLVCVYRIATAKTKQDFYRAGNYLKWLMLGGLMALLVLSYLMK